MQYINLNKVIDLECEIDDLLLISIDDQVDTIDDKDGIRITGKIAVGGKVKTNNDNKEFSENIDIDIFLTYEEIVERNSLSISVNDFNYKIENNKIYLDISLRIDGLKEIETTFLSQEDDEVSLQEKIEEEKRVFIDEDLATNQIEEENDNKEIEEREEDIIEEQDIEPVVEEVEKNIVEEAIPKKSLLKSVFSNKRIKEEISWRLHCVKTETSYEEIAGKYNVNLQKLISINNNEKLKEGKLIFLPLE